jgi:hypothetical protein
MNGRSIAATFAGIIVGAIIAYFLVPLLDKVYPPEVDVLKSLADDREALGNYIRNLPAGFHFLGIAIGMIRLIAGLVVGGLIDKLNLMTLIVIGAFSLLLAVLDVLALPHPIWFGFVYIPAIIGITAAFVYMRKKA